MAPFFFCRFIMEAKHVNSLLFGTVKVSIKSRGWLFVNHAILSRTLYASLRYDSQVSVAGWLERAFNIRRGLLDNLDDCRSS
jgi:hypothetical protein